MTGMFSAKFFGEGNEAHWAVEVTMVARILNCCHNSSKTAYL